jgi:hypothetical protein
MRWLDGIMSGSSSPEWVPSNPRNRENSVGGRGRTDNNAFDVRPLDRRPAACWRRHAADAVQIAFGAVAVPEPATCASLLAGLGFSGIMAWRRRRSG